ncbi:hypothetical protein J4437_07990 [Candidatus Woesearchaeota archaeon]|nr:hypothetical protein [Candidatus Woesearchaeota archaeon]
MAGIETLAWVFFIVAAVKLIVVLVSPKIWLNSVVRKIWKNSFLAGLVSFVLAVVCLYILLQELTIVQIFAVMLFVSLLAALGIAAYSKEVVGLAEKLMKDKKILKKSWFYLLIWIALVVWGLAALLS